MYWLCLASRRSPDALFNSKDLEVIRRGRCIRGQCIAVSIEPSKQSLAAREVDTREVDTIAAGIEFCWCGVESLKANP